MRTKALARAAMLPDRIAQLEVSIAGQTAGQLLRRSVYEFRYMDPRPDQPSVALLMPASPAYPGLAANEYLCMLMAREAGIPVPEFYLSRNRQLFVMKRFDRSAQGVAMGFEDMAVLGGLSAREKYDRSYAFIARLIQSFASPEHVATSLRSLFDRVALSCIVGNGDAHLKNFGLLYSDPTTQDCQLAPAYDIVNTTAYIPEDALALELHGQRSFFASREGLLQFAAQRRDLGRRPEARRSRDQLARQRASGRGRQGPVGAGPGRRPRERGGTWRDAVGAATRRPGARRVRARRPAGRARAHTPPVARLDAHGRAGVHNPR